MKAARKNCFDQIEALLDDHRKTLSLIANYEKLLGSKKAMIKAIQKDLDHILLPGFFSGWPSGTQYRGRPKGGETQRPARHRLCFRLFLVKTDRK